MGWIEICVKFVHLQWRIQDFPEEGAPTPKLDVKSYYLANFPHEI